MMIDVDVFSPLFSRYKKKGPTASLASPYSITAASSKGDLKTCNSCRPGETDLRPQRAGDAAMLPCFAVIGTMLDIFGSSISKYF